MIPLENHNNNENQIMSRENYENQKIIRIRCNSQEKKIILRENYENH